MKIFLGVDYNRVENIPSKKILRSSLAIMNTSQAVCFEDNHEYTLLKNSLKLFGLLRKFS